MVMQRSLNCAFIWVFIHNNQKDCHPIAFHNNSHDFDIYELWLPGYFGINEADGRGNEVGVNHVLLGR